MWEIEERLVGHVGLVVVLVCMKNALGLLHFLDLQVEGNLPPKVERCLEDVGGAAEALLDTCAAMLAGVGVTADGAAVMRYGGGR